MVRKATLALAVALASPTYAQQLPPGATFAGEETGSDLVILCSANDNSFRSGLCAGFIAGSIQRDKIAGYMDPKSRYTCNFPSNATNAQLTAIVRKYLNDHPEKWNHMASSLVLIALRDAFCRK